MCIVILHKYQFLSISLNSISLRLNYAAYMHTKYYRFTYLTNDIHLRGLQFPTSRSHALAPCSPISLSMCPLDSGETFQGIWAGTWSLVPSPCLIRSLNGAIKVLRGTRKATWRGKRHQQRCPGVPPYDALWNGDRWLQAGEKWNLEYRAGELERSQN